LFVALRNLFEFEATPENVQVYEDARRELEEIPGEFRKMLDVPVQ